MQRFVIASLDKNAGKTSLIVGLGKAIGKSFAYMKPLGDRLLYRKKRQWDYDSALISGVFGLSELPESITLGFDHTKLRYMYDEASLAAKLNDTVACFTGGEEVLLVEGTRSLWYGASVGLDPLAVARKLQAKVIVLISGDSDSIADQLCMVKRSIAWEGLALAGVIANKVPDPDEFRDTQADLLQALDLPLLGVVPFAERLTHMTMRFIADQLFAKVIAAEEELNHEVENFFVGTMPASSALRHPDFSKEHTLIVAAADRSDVLQAALDANPAGIVLTEQMLPPANIVSKAADRGIPLLLVSQDTTQVIRQLDALDPLLTPAESGKVELLTQLVKDHVKLDFLG